MGVSINTKEKDTKNQQYFVESEKKVVRDRPIKSILKAITWRIIATITTFFITWYVTGSTTAGYTIGAGDFVIKFVLYFLHERAWAQARWGRMLVKMRRNTPLSKNAFNKIFKVKK